VIAMACVSTISWMRRNRRVRAAFEHAEIGATPDRVDEDALAPVPTDRCWYGPGEDPGFCPSATTTAPTTSSWIVSPIIVFNS